MHIFYKSESTFVSRKYCNYCERQNVQRTLKLNDSRFQVTEKLKLARHHLSSHPLKTIVLYGVYHPDQMFETQRFVLLFRQHNG
jgi:hypothetical protein